MKLPNNWQPQKTAEEIIFAYIKHFGLKQISYHTFERIKQYAVRRWGIFKNVGTYDRTFRNMKSKYPTMFAEKRRPKNQSRTYGTWNILRTSF